MLVGHSYGGNVISMAATGNNQVKALVYLNGWMCDEGESQQQLLERFEGSLVGPSIRPVPYTGPDGTEGADLYLDPQRVPRDLRRRCRPADGRGNGRSAAAVRRSRVRRHTVGPAGVEDAAVLVPARHRGQGDPPALQHFMAERANATIVEVPASHVSFVSQPEAATQLILRAVEAVSHTDSDSA